MNKDFTADMSALYGMAGKYSVTMPEDQRNNDSVFKIKCTDDQWPSAFARTTDYSFEIHIAGGMEFDAFVRFICEYGATTGVCNIIKPNVV